MVRTSKAAASRASGKSLKTKAHTMDNTGRTSTIATPFGRLSAPIASGKRFGPAWLDEAPETFHHCECNCSLEESRSMVSCSMVPNQVCMTRGQQDLCDWWRESDSIKVLGKVKECFQSLAQQCLLSVQTPDTTTLQVLSLSDGYMDHSECVPTSFLLAHAFASLGIDALPSGLERVRIFGADVENPRGRCSEAQRGLWMPPWLELEHVHLDNNTDFTPQLLKCGHPAKFDVVLMRQGLCYCEDRSFDCRPPEKLYLDLAGINTEDSALYGHPSGTYILEPTFYNGRPCYRNGNFLLLWRSCCKDWAVVQDDETDFLWANCCKDSGSPAVAQSTWFVWDGKDYSSDLGVTCEVTGPCPWRRPPDACKCCAGIEMNSCALHTFIRRVASVLDLRNPRTFALLHGGYYQGVKEEVEDFSLELERAAERFNSSRSGISTVVLWRQEEQQVNNDPARYWNQINGLLLSARPA